jgi:hypothetical protein
MSAVGFSYTYLTSDNLKLQQAVVTNGTLAAEGPAIKALVVPGKSSITEDVIDNLIQYANAGLPIVVAGSLSIYPSAHAPSKEEQEQAISRLRFPQTSFSKGGRGGGQAAVTRSFAACEGAGQWDMVHHFPVGFSGRPGLHLCSRGSQGHIWVFDNQRFWNPIPF